MRLLDLKMDKLLEQLDQNLRELYRKAVDADAILDDIAAQGKGKHHAIFADEQLFMVRSNRFLPYLSETAEQIAAIRQTQQFNTATLQRVVKQLQQLHQLLADFKVVMTK
jgi:primosomal protein N''